MSNPLVSVIMPFYNNEQHVGQAIASVLRQDYQPLEVIAVDDGSTDNSAATVAARPAVRLLRQANAGPGAARNLGIAAASGAFIAFIDADDLWDRGKISAQVRALQQAPEAGYAACHSRYRLSRGTPWPWWVPPEMRRQPQPSYVPSALIMRREALDVVGLFNTDLRLASDLDWIVRARDLGVPALMLPEVLFSRRVHAGNSMHDQSGIRHETMRVLQAAARRKRQAAPQ